MLKVIQLRFDFEIGCKGSGILLGVQVQMHPKSYEVGCVCTNTAENAILAAIHGAKCPYLGYIFALGDRKMI